jgi:hypothetical protein
MEEFKIPTTLINMCKTCVQKTRSVVIIGGTSSSFSDNKEGLKQGDFITNIIQFSIKKVIQSIKMVPSCITGKEQLNILAYADDIVLIGENETEIRQLFVEMENTARKLDYR